MGDSLRDRIAAALHAHDCGCPEFPATPDPYYDEFADVVMGVLSEQPWTGWAYVGQFEADVQARFYETFADEQRTADPP